MAKGAFARAEFDRNRVFVVAREFTVSGCVLGPGELFNKGLVTDRRLRQLYDQRFLKFGEGSDDSISFEKPRAIGEAVMGNVPHKKPQELDKGGFLGTGLPVVPYHQDKDEQAVPLIEEGQNNPVEAQPDLQELPVEQPEQVKQEHDDGRPDFSSMPREELVKYLETEPKVIVRRGWGQARLAFLAAGKWKDQQRAVKPQE